MRSKDRISCQTIVRFVICEQIFTTNARFFCEFVVFFDNIVWSKDFGTTKAKFVLIIKTS